MNTRRPCSYVHCEGGHSFLVEGTRERVSRRIANAKENGAQTHPLTFVKYAGTGFSSDWPEPRGMVDIWPSKVSGVTAHVTEGP